MKENNIASCHLTVQKLQPTIYLNRSSLFSFELKIIQHQKKMTQENQKWIPGTESIPTFNINLVSESHAQTRIYIIFHTIWLQHTITKGTQNTGTVYHLKQHHPIKQRHTQTTC